MFYSNGAYSLFKVDTPVISGGATPPFEDVYSYQFDGVDDYIDTNSIYSELNGTTKATFSFWIKPQDNGLRILLHVPINNTNANGQFLIYQRSGRIQMNIDTASYYCRTPDNTLILNQWQHVMICMNLPSTDEGKIFINGVDQTSVENWGNRTALSTSIGGLYIGEANNGYLSPFYGNLDEVAIWSGADLRDDVSTIYNGGVPNNLNDNGLTSPTTWFRMGESANWDGSNWTLTDQGSGGNNATSQNMIEASRVTDVPPNPFTSTKSILLDGIDDFVRIGTTSLGITNAISISAWAKTNSSTSNQYIIAEDPRSTNNRNWLLQFRANGEIQCVIWASNGSSVTSAITPLTYNNGNWTHVLATFDGTTNANGLKIYVNGVNVVQATASVSGIFSSSSSEPIIGGDSTTPTLPFNGNIDEVAIWDNDQSANASAIFNSGTPNDLASLSPLSWWRCGDNDTAPILTDNGSGSNDGTMTNFSTFSTDVPT